MKESPFILDNVEDEEPNFTTLVAKYLRYWSWFLLAAVIGILFGFLYMQYTPTIYVSTAKIKIINNKEETDIATEAISSAWWLAGINLANEIEVFKSYRLLGQVVTELHLDIAYYEVGTFKTTELWNPPFVVTKYASEDRITESQYFDIAVSDEGITVKDESGKMFYSPPNVKDFSEVDLPFSIQIADSVELGDMAERNYMIALHPMKETVMELMNSLQVETANKKSDILTLWLVGQSMERSEEILNTVIDKFNKDGILDRQLISKRTLDFIDQRFIYLGGELDSIEIGKQNFKQSSNLSYIEEDATSLIQKKSIAEAEVFDLETQISLSRLLKSSVTKEAQYGMLPSDIGLENSSINALVSGYNELALQRGKLSSSVGASHPSLQQINGQLERGKKNILRTIDIYQRQLNLSLKQMNQEKNLAGEMFSRLPEKEKMLRSIERQQSIKENLFVLLLQKREEAAINYAVTAPAIKVVDYAISYNEPVSPKRKIVYPVSILLGIMGPFIVLFVRFWLDTKIHDRSDIVKRNPEIPILGEIPYSEDGTSFIEPDDRSILAESFRILSTNIDYQLSALEIDRAKVIYVTSSVNGEGKTLTALNLSLAYASLKKRVLLVGCDLRNPQLHKYFDIEKSVTGISDYLNDNKIDWEQCIHKGFGKNSFHKVCFSGQVPSNPPQLLAGKRFEEFINISRKSFDYVIVDTAPTILVTDTMLISKHADLTLFVVRAGFTEKQLLEYSKNLNKSGKMLNMSYVINNVGEGSQYDYNYGYGYGYGNEKPNHSWLKDFLFKVKSDGIIQAISIGFDSFKERIKARFF